MMRGIFLLGLALVLASCNASDDCLTKLAPWSDPSGTRLNLAQCWEKKDLTRFYTTSLGTQLIRYELLMPLELAVPDKTDSLKLVFTGEPFFNRSHFEERWRFLAMENSDWDEHSNVYKADIETGWPVGFVIDERTSGKPKWQGQWVGPTCAACHAGQVEYRGKKLRVAGGPSMADVNLFLQDLKNSLIVVHDDGINGGAKFNEYVARYTNKFGQKDPKDLLSELHEAVTDRTEWHARNDPTSQPGYARLDAFGVIFNELIDMTGKVGVKRPDAPVSYPFLWDFSHHNLTQWNGSGPAMPMAVNIVGVLGIFAKYDPAAGWFEEPSTIRLPALRRLQELIDRLRSPQWPQDILGAYDSQRVAAGRQLFKDNCLRCHAEQKREKPLARNKVHMVNVKEIHTDSRMVDLADHRELTDPNGQHRESILLKSLGNALFGILFRSHPREWLSFFGEGLSMLITLQIPNLDLDDYKGRPLDGIWATAPYLHNGSVANLYELLLPAHERMKGFCVGSREFDPAHVGFVTSKDQAACQYSWLDTMRPGNSNAGHEYGVMVCGPDDTGCQNKRGEEILTLVEYMKTL